MTGRSGAIVAAVALDAGTWTVLGLLLHQPMSERGQEPDPTRVEIVEPSVPAPAGPPLPILDAPDLASDEAPAHPHALAQHDFAPLRETRRRTRSGAIVRRHIAVATARPATTASEPTAPAPAPLPLVEGGDDVPEDLPPGAANRVATLASPLAAYLDEVRRAVRSHWHPSAVYRRVDPESSSQATGHTVLRVTIGPDGALADLTLDTPSGMAALDQEAEAAFRRAVPFPPPPPEILDRFGRLPFRFGMLLDLAAARFLAATAHVVREAWRQHAGLRSRDADRLIVVRLRVHADGALADATVETSAGELDDRALEVLHAVAVYPRPPPSLLAPDALAQVRAAFVLRRTGADAVHVFRHPASPSYLMGGR